MVVFSYGIPKSGSTLAFEIARCVAVLGGHPQRLLPESLRAPGHRVNFHQGLDADLLRRVADRAGDGVLLVKTHERPGPAWIAAYETLAAEGRAAVHLNHRDPRDICLSLLDAGRAARSQGKLAFSEYATLDDTAQRVHRYLDELAVWARLPAVLPLRYETVAFRMDEAIDPIKAHLGVRCPNWLVRLYAGRIAFTHRNKAVPERHRCELSDEDADRLSEAFSDYLRTMGYLSA